MQEAGVCLTPTCNVHHVAKQVALKVKNLSTIGTSIKSLPNRKLLKFENLCPAKLT